MTSASRRTYAPYEPIGVPKPFGTDLWIVDGPTIGYRLGGVTIPCPTRMTLARLPDGSLWAHSPIAPTDGVRREIEALGPVGHVVVPNGLHTTHAGAWARAYPSAAVHAPAGLSRRTRDALPAHASLDDEPPPAWGGAFAMVRVRGDGFVEVVFHHCASRTLIVTDLLQRFEADRMDGRLARTLLRLGGATGPVATPSIEVRAMLLRHRRSFREALARMKAWRPERIVLAHGRCIAADGASELERAFPE